MPEIWKRQLLLEGRGEGTSDYKICDLVGGGRLFNC
jgi:hypothetical protein